MATKTQSAFDSIKRHLSSGEQATNDARDVWRQFCEQLADGSSLTEDQRLLVPALAELLGVEGNPYEALDSDVRAVRNLRSTMATINETDPAELLKEMASVMAEEKLLETNLRVLRIEKQKLHWTIRSRASNVGSLQIFRADHPRIFVD